MDWAVTGKALGRTAFPSWGDMRGLDSIEAGARGDDGGEAWMVAAPRMGTLDIGYWALAMAGEGNDRRQFQAWRVEKEEEEEEQKETKENTGNLTQLAPARYRSTDHGRKV